MAVPVDDVFVRFLLGLLVRRVIQQGFVPGVFDELFHLLGIGALRLAFQLLLEFGRNRLPHPAFLGIHFRGQFIQRGIPEWRGADVTQRAFQFGAARNLGLRGPEIQHVLVGFVAADAQIRHDDRQLRQLELGAQILHQMDEIRTIFIIHLLPDLIAGLTHVVPSLEPNEPAELGFETF